MINIAPDSNANFCERAFATSSQGKEGGDIVQANVEKYYPKPTVSSAQMKLLKLGDNDTTNALINAVVFATDVAGTGALRAVDAALRDILIQVRTCDPGSNVDVQKKDFYLSDLLGDSTTIFVQPSIAVIKERSPKPKSQYYADMQRHFYTEHTPAVPEFFPYERKLLLLYRTLDVVNKTSPKYHTFNIRYKILNVSIVKKADANYTIDIFVEDTYANNKIKVNKTSSPYDLVRTFDGNKAVCWPGRLFNEFSKRCDIQNPQGFTGCDVVEHCQCVLCRDGYILTWDKKCAKLLSKKIGNCGKDCLRCEERVVPVLPNWEFDEGRFMLWKQEKKKIDFYEGAKSECAKLNANY
jgi:hypothetical protein